MTNDNSGNHRDDGNPGGDIEPNDVIKCRECAGLVRRVNAQHLRADRCKYVRQNDQREHQERDNHPTSVDEYREKYPDAPVISPREKTELSEAAISPEVEQRRREMAKRRWNGEDMSSIVSSLSNKYDVTENAVWRDWSKRDEWLARAFGVANAEQAVLEALAQKTSVREDLVSIATRAKSENEYQQAIRALKAVDENINDAIEAQQDLGRVAKAAQKHEVDVKGEVQHEHKQDPGADLSEEQVANLDEATGGDVIDAEFEEVDDGGE